MVLTIIINRFNKESGNLNVQKPKEAVSFGWEKLSKFSISNFSALLFSVFCFFTLCGLIYFALIARNTLAPA